MLQIRARLLRDICFDMSYHSKTKWISADVLARMFDLVDQFETELLAQIEADVEIRNCYGQVLSRISNIAAQVVNPNLPTRKTTIGVVESETDTDMSRRFASVAEEEETPDEFKPAPDKLIAVAVERLPSLQARAEPFLFVGDSYSVREPFVDCYKDILGSVYWAKRDDNKKGGYWPTPRNKTEFKALLDFRNSLDDRIKKASTIDDFTVICSLLISTTYAEWNTTAQIYHDFSKRLATVVNDFESIAPDQASRMLVYNGNFLHGIIQNTENMEDTEAYASITIVDQTTASVVERVDTSLFQDEKLARRYFDSIFDIVNRRCHELAHTKRAFPAELTVEVLKQATSITEQLRVTPDVLEGITALLSLFPQHKDDWSDAQRNQYQYLWPLIIRLVDDGRFDGDGFRRPGYDNLGYLLWNWVMRNGATVIHLDDKRITALLNLLEVKVGKPARTLLIDLCADTSIDLWHPRPISPLADYLQMLRCHDDITPKLAEASLTIWAQHLLAGQTDRVLHEVRALLPSDGEVADAIVLQGAGLAFRGITLLASGFAPNQMLLTEFGQQLRELKLQGYAGTSELYRAGSSMEIALQVTENHDNALNAAVSALARLDILDGGDPLSWTKAAEAKDKRESDE